jgi:hypothetical protein
MDLLLEEESGMPAMADADEACVPSASLLSCTSLPAFASIRQASGVVGGRVNSATPARAAGFDF